MDFYGRLALFICALMITWYINREKNRYEKMLSWANAQKAERRIGELSVTYRNYLNFLGFMQFLDIFLFVNLIADPFF